MRRLQDALGASADYFCMGYQRDEAPQLFDEVRSPELLARAGRGLEDQDRAVLADAALCAVVRAEIANPENNDYVETLVHVADALADLLQGVVHDVRMGVVWGRREWKERVMEEPFSVLNHVAVEGLAAGASEGAVRTRGLRKFGSPDLEVLRVPRDVEAEISGLLRDVAEHLAQGEVLGDDERIDYGIGRIRLVAVPPPAGSGPDANDLFRLVDETDESADGAAGMPALVESLRAERKKPKEQGEEEAR
jgi:hypothetical protein